jgi:hypothetical protein
MNEEMKQAMEIVSIRILEDAAFLFVAPAEEGTGPGPDWKAAGAELRWSGPREGTMRVWAEPSLLGVLSANMLGIEEDDPAAAAAGPDALREILNMVVGNCLTEAWGPGPVFQLSVPEEADPDLLARDAEDGFWILAEDKPVLFHCGGSP